MTPPRPPYTPRQALAIFKRAFTHEGAVLPIRHFGQAMADPEDPFDDQDVLSVRAAGAITTPPELDAKRGEWVYRVVGPDCEGRRLAIIFVPLDDRTVKLVTGFHPDRRRA